VNGLLTAIPAVADQAVVDRSTRATPTTLRAPATGTTWAASTASKSATAASTAKASAAETSTPGATSTWTSTAEAWTCALRSAGAVLALQPVLLSEGIRIATRATCKAGA